MSLSWFLECIYLSCIAVLYCNALFTGLPSKSIGNLQVIQNAAARLFGGLRKYDYVTSTMKTELHWLRIPERISFKLSTLVYKTLRGEGPARIWGNCAFRWATISICPATGRKTHTATYGGRAFSAAGPATWNSLPVEIRQSETLTVSKSKLNTFLFSKSYHVK